MSVYFADPPIYNREKKGCIDDLKQLLGRIFQDMGAIAQCDPSQLPSDPWRLAVLSPYAVPSILELARRYYDIESCDEHSEPPSDDEDAAEFWSDFMSGFLYALWNTAIRLSLCPLYQHEHCPRVTAGIQLITGLGSIQRDERSIIEWRNLPLLGECLRDLFNFPIDETEVSSTILLSAETQRALAGVGPAADQITEELVEKRELWFALNHLPGSKLSVMSHLFGTLFGM
ncbi:hypothetical protein RhiLY_10903 [Ceratobasidium sp. AG-Ba]|nr:hypothetical protein RhiLY_10903 [Ceratobasidium sp. AG-Ba]